MPKRQMTIDELFDSVPMGGQLIVYAPLPDVIEAAHSRNCRFAGEWFNVSSVIDKRDNLVVIISRKELWNIASTNLLLQEQHRWQRMDNVWRT